MRRWALPVLAMLLAGCAGSAPPPTLESGTALEAGTGNVTAPLMVPLAPATVDLTPPASIRVPVVGGQPVILLATFRTAARLVTFIYESTAEDAGAASAYLMAPPEVLSTATAPCEPPAGLSYGFVRGGSSNVNQSRPEGAQAIVLASSHAGAFTISASDDDYVIMTPAPTNVTATPLQGIATFIWPDASGSGPMSPGMDFEAPADLVSGSFFLGHFSISELAQASPYRIEMALADPSGAECGRAARDAIVIGAAAVVDPPRLALAAIAGPAGAYTWTGAYRPVAPSAQADARAGGVVLAWPPATMLVPATPGDD